jgi:hypothetical protein
VRAVETKSRYDETRQHYVAESQNVSVNGLLRFEEQVMSQRTNSQRSYPLEFVAPERSKTQSCNCNRDGTSVAPMSLVIARGLLKPPCLVIRNAAETSTSEYLRKCRKTKKEKHT